MILDTRVGLGSPLCQARWEQGCPFLSLFRSISLRAANHTTSRPNWWCTAESPHQIPDGSSWSSSHGSSGTTRKGSTNTAYSSRRRRIPVRTESKDKKSVTHRPGWDPQGRRLFTGRLQLVLESKVNISSTDLILLPDYFRVDFFFFHPAQQLDIASRVIQGDCTSVCLSPDKDPGH